MKRIALFAALAVLSSTALAHGRVSVGVSFGFPLYYPYPYWYHPAPVYYYPVTPPSPPVYVEKSDDYWHYCEQTRAYYPYVKECIGGWKRVPPVPAPAK